MTQREKLIELMLRASIDMFNIQTESIEVIADYLLAKGVVVLPCKEGDTLHRVVIPKYDVKPFIWGGIDVVEVIGAGCKSPFGGYSFVSFDDFGKTVFLTREEAEAALANMEGEK